MGGWRGAGTGLSASGGPGPPLGGRWGVGGVAGHVSGALGAPVPAVAVLAVVLLAQLMAACDGRRAPPAPAPRPRVVALAAAAALVAAGGLSAWDAWTAERADR